MTRSKGSWTRRTQITGKSFCVISDDYETERRIISYIMSKGGICRRDPRHPKVRYIVLDIPSYVSVIEVPYNEPRTALSAPNMVRNYGHMLVRGHYVHPDRWMPKIVSADWLPQAAQGHAEIRWIEGRDRPTTYFDHIGRQTRFPWRPTVRFAEEEIRH